MATPTLSHLSINDFIHRAGVREENQDDQAAYNAALAGAMSNLGTNPLLPAPLLEYDAFWSSNVTRDTPHDLGDDPNSPHGRVGAFFNRDESSDPFAKDFGHQTELSDGTLERAVQHQTPPNASGTPTGRLEREVDDAVGPMAADNDCDPGQVEREEDHDSWKPVPVPIYQDDGDNSAYDSDDDTIPVDTSVMGRRLQIAATRNMGNACQEYPGIIPNEADDEMKARAVHELTKIRKNIDAANPKLPPLIPQGRNLPGHVLEMVSDPLQIKAIGDATRRIPDMGEIRAMGLLREGPIEMYLKGNKKFGPITVVIMENGDIVPGVVVDGEVRIQIRGVPMTHEHEAYALNLQLYQLPSYSRTKGDKEVPQNVRYSFEGALICTMAASDLFEIRDGTCDGLLVNLATLVRLYQLYAIMEIVEAEPPQFDLTKLGMAEYVAATMASYRQPTARIEKTWMIVLMMMIEQTRSAASKIGYDLDLSMPVGATEAKVVFKKTKVKQFEPALKWIATTEVVERVESHRRLGTREKAAFFRPCLVDEDRMKKTVALSRTMATIMLGTGAHRSLNASVKKGKGKGVEAMVHDTNEIFDNMSPVEVAYTVGMYETNELYMPQHPGDNSCMHTATHNFTSMDLPDMVDYEPPTFLEGDDQDAEMQAKMEAMEIEMGEMRTKMETMQLELDAHTPAPTTVEMEVQTPMVELVSKMSQVTVETVTASTSMHGVATTAEMEVQTHPVEVTINLPTWFTLTSTLDTAHELVVADTATTTATTERTSGSRKRPEPEHGDDKRPESPRKRAITPPVVEMVVDAAPTPVDAQVQAEVEAASGTLVKNLTALGARKRGSEGRPTSPRKRPTTPVVESEPEEPEEPVVPEDNGTTETLMPNGLVLVEMTGAAADVGMRKVKKVKTTWRERKNLYKMRGRPQRKAAQVADNRMAAMSIAASVSNWEFFRGCKQKL